MLEEWPLLELMILADLLASEISELCRTAKWHEPPEGIKEEDDLLTGEELKLFQSVAARVTLSAMGRPDLFYSVRVLMRKMASSSGESELAAVVPCSNR